MLIGIDPRMTPALMDVLMRMGHGDEIVLADANFPADSTAASCRLTSPIHLPGFSAPEAVDLITKYMPLDGFAEACAWRMEIDGAPEEMGAVHEEAFARLDACKPEGAALGSIARHDFYPRARSAFAVVATAETRPYGCFILKKGVVL